VFFRETAQLKNSDPMLVKKNRSLSVNVGNKVTKCAIIMVHRNEMQEKIAVRQANALDCYPIVVERPECNDGEEVTKSIARLKVGMDEARKKLNLTGASGQLQIGYVLVEANYSNVGSPEPNVPLLLELVSQFEKSHIIAISFSQQCLDAVKENSAFSKIIATDKCSSAINDLMKQSPPNMRKHSSP
jgi:hypothetical protein